jgi:hypothetical protein
MNRGQDHDSFDEQIPGRIPESLIDAALDGEICDRMQEEIAHALQYDHERRAELLETADAVRAMGLDDIPMPDLQCAVLNRLDQHERFIPRTMRRWVRTGRMAIAAGVLLGLMLVAGLQSIYPRLTTIGAQSTPVHDVATAVEQDTQRVAEDVQSRVARVRASLSPLEGLLAAPKPSGAKTFTLTINHQVVRLTEADLSALHAAGVMVHSNTERNRFPGQLGKAVTFVSYGGDGEMLINSQNQLRTFVTTRETSGGVLVSERVELEATSDECITDLP